MTFAEDIWLRGKAAQTSMMQIMAYNTAIAGTATIQAWKLGLGAPMSFWQALGRAGGLRAAPRVAARPATPKPRAAAPPPAAEKPVSPPVAEKPAPPPMKEKPAPASAAPAAPKPAPAAPPVAAKPAAASAATAAPAPATPKPKPQAAPAKPKAVARPKAKAPAKPKAEPAPSAPAPSPHLLDAPRGGKPDDLTELSGVGQKLAAALNEFGIYHFDQLATLDAEGVEWLNEQQPGFKMIAARYKVVDQAKTRQTG